MVYSHLFPAKLACLIKRKPMIITWHEVWGKDYWQKYMGKKGLAGALIEKISSKLATKIIAVSDETKNNLIKVLKVPGEKIITIENAIDFEKIQKIKPSKEKSDLIFAGRLNEHKNVDILIKAVAKIAKSTKNQQPITNNAKPQFRSLKAKSGEALKTKNQKPKTKNHALRCLIIGDGPEMEKLKDLVKKLGLEKNIIFKGFVEKSEDVLALMKSSKVFVLPSTREGFGISVIEAHACGLPVVTTNHKDNASKDLIVEGKNGFVCGLSGKEIAGKVLKGFGIGKVDVGVVREYDWEKIVGEFEGVYLG